MAKSQVASGARSSDKRTAPPNEPASVERARANRLEAKARTSERAGSKGVNRQTENYFSRRSIAEHSENPDRPADSTVRHALPQTGAGSEGQKGFPQGEYDVIEPAKAGPASQRSTIDMLIDQHLGFGDPDEVMKSVNESTRLDHEERVLILESAPAGFVLEKMGDRRWRAGAQNRYGHGTTAAQAIESFVLGTESGADADAIRFANYPASVQKEIRARDEAVAKRAGIPVDSLPEAVARREGLERAAVENEAAASALNAVSDGPEKASALNEAGAKGEESSTKSGRKSASKKSAARKSATKSTRKGTKRGSKK